MEMLRDISDQISAIRSQKQWRVAGGKWRGGGKRKAEQADKVVSDRRPGSRGRERSASSGMRGATPGAFLG